MTAKIIDGEILAKRIRSEIALEAEAFTQKHGYSPGLGVVLVGDDPASAMYVRMKRRACKRVGIESIAHILPSASTQEDVLKVVKSLNDDPKVHGILVQLPLPKHIDDEAVLDEISLEKDADGIHPINMGLLGMKGRESYFTPATPTGCMALLEEAGVDLNGKNAVVLGRSNIVGLPVALMLNNANATVSIVHSRTPNPESFIKNADILIAAVGIPNYVKGEWLKPGVVVIDVGSNSVDAPETEKGYRYVGDVDFESASEVASAITKVPGGVGPMTITVLIQNTMKAAWNIAGR